MSKNTPEALCSDLGGYTSRYDDGTNRYAEWVEIEGVPGRWPEGPHRAAVARSAQTLYYMAQDLPDSVRPVDEKIAGVVQGANDLYRMQDPEEAHQAAHYEDVLRGCLPEAREGLIAAHGALRAYQDTYGAPEEPKYDPGYLPSAQEVMDDRLAAQQRFAESVNPEVLDEGIRLGADYRSAQVRLEELCADLYGRSWKAARDYNEGVDNTQAVQSADYAKYGEAR